MPVPVPSSPGPFKDGLPSKITSQCPEGHVQLRECSERAVQRCRKCTNTESIQQEELRRQRGKDSLSLDSDWRITRQIPTWKPQRGRPSLHGYCGDARNEDLFAFQDRKHWRDKQERENTSSLRTVTAQVPCPPERTALFTRPRGTPSELIAAELGDPSSDSDADTIETRKAKSAQMCPADAQKNIEWGVDEFFVTRTLVSAEDCFSLLPSTFHYLFVEKLMLKAARSKRADARLVAELFTSVCSKHLSSREVFEEGFRTAAKHSDDIAIDHLMAYELINLMISLSNVYQLDETHPA
ncbi:hypothetical protein IW262DRAFT_1466800 [Armillaria fumosa]|nr:hypothetical protein IW262DRAFT_1466800 [Armillaria fumosa]